MFKKIAGFISLFICCSVILAGCVADNKITITLNDSWSYDIKSPNPVKIDKGADASFAVSFKDDYGFNKDLNTDCYFVPETSSVVFPNRTESAKVSFFVKKQAGSYSFEYSFTSTRGEVVSSHPNGSYTTNTKIEVSATPNRNFIFGGWSLNGYLTESNSVLVTTATNYSFNLTKNTLLYANFVRPSDVEYSFRYMGNGGSMENGATEYANIHHTTYQHIFINTLLGTNYFSRNGYTLESWNTKADGNGQRIGLGSRIQPKEDKSLQILYAQWAEWENVSNFEYSTNKSGISLTKYTGFSKVLVIPEKIGASFVTVIEPGFLVSGNVEKVIFPKSLERVEDGAFSSCESLHSLLFFDSLKYIDENSFSQCDNLSRLYVNAAGLPKYIWSPTAKIADMIDKMSITTDKKKMIFASDSLVAVGVNSPAIYDAFNGEYQLFNLGSEGLTSMSCILSLVDPYIKTGDVFIDWNKYSYNTDVSFGNKWVIFEANYDLLSSIDLRFRGTGVAGRWLWGFTEFNRNRQVFDDTSYERNIYFDNYDEFGDIFYNDSGHSEDWKVSAGYEQYFSIGDSPAAIAFHKPYIQSFLARGARAYRAFPAWNINAAEESYATKATFDAYIQSLNSYTDYTIISYPGDYGLTGQYFAMDNFHVCQSGAIKQTELLIKDLKAQFAKEN